MAQSLPLWVARMGELSRYQASEVPWPEIWSLIAYALRNEDRFWLIDHLWRLKLWSWIASLEADPATCRYCGGLIAKPGPLSLHCSVACRKAKYRCVKANKPSPFDELVGQADIELRAIQKIIADTQRWERRSRRFQANFTTFPPDLSRVDHLPSLPRRCGGRCEGAHPACPNTGGGLCLYAQTGILGFPDIPEEG